MSAAVGTTSSVRIKMTTAFLTNIELLIPAMLNWIQTQFYTIDTTQVTFDYDTVVSGITTIGRADAANWVTSYTLQYSTDEAIYLPIQEAGADVVSQ